ncbi:MAG: Flp family type IVb pilin [Pseudomonas marincola]
MIKMFRAFVNDESGATAIEYGLIAALVALVGVVAFTALGDTIADTFEQLAFVLCDSAEGTYAAGACTF